MTELPSGTVTLLFADVEGSTRLVQQLGDGYGGVLDQLRQLLRTAVADAGGYEVDCRADEMFVAFQRAKDGVDAAVAAQQLIGAYAWPELAVVRVRMGLHTGEPVVESGVYLGLDVNRAARICSAGHGGQILLADDARPGGRLCRAHRPRRVCFGWAASSGTTLRTRRARSTVGLPTTPSRRRGPQPTPRDAAGTPIAAAESGRDCLASPDAAAQGRAAIPEALGRARC